jgi:hypothetical protein
MEHQPGRTGSSDHRAFELTVDDLSDGRPDQRPLTPAQRCQVAAYIAAIVRRPARAAAAESEETLMLGLWVSFRDAYDALRGPYGHSDDEDFWLAMQRL